MNLASTKRRSWFVTLVLLLAIPLALLLSRASGGIVRDVLVVPLLYLVWVVRLYLGAVPQVLFWGALLVFGLALASTTVLVDLSRRRRDSRGIHGGSAAVRDAIGPVQRLTSQIHFAERSTYFRRHLAQRLGSLMLQHLDYGDQYRPARIEHALEDLSAPPEIRAFLLEGTESISATRSTGLFRWLRHRLLGWEDVDPPRFDLEQVVRFLEDRLEVS